MRLYHVYMHTVYTKHQIVGKKKDLNAARLQSVYEAFCYFH